MIHPMIVRALASLPAGVGWKAFFKRHGFSLRRRTTVRQRVPRDLVPKVVSFVMNVRRRM